MEIKIITEFGVHTVTGFAIGDGKVVRVEDVSRLRIKEQEDALSINVADNAVYVDLE